MRVPRRLGLVGRARDVVTRETGGEVPAESPLGARTPEVSVV